MQIIGLTGGIASGKSTACSFFRQNNIPVIDADALAKDALNRDTTAYLLTCREFPEAINSNTGNLDRAMLGEIIFNDPSAKRKLEKIIHPYVFKNIILSILRYWICGRLRVVVDVPLLFETKLDKWVTFTVVICCDEVTQRERLIRRNDLTLEQANARIKAQMPLEEKCRLADVIIQNDNEVEDLYKELQDKVVDAKRPSFVIHLVLFLILPISIVTISLLCLIRQFL